MVFKDYHILNMIGKVLAGPSAPTAIQFTAQPTCNLYQTCLECTTQMPADCVWCDSARKCTRKDAKDREWQKLEDALCYRPSHQVSHSPNQHQLLTADVKNGCRLYYFLTVFGGFF